MFAVPGWSVSADALKTQRPSRINEDQNSTRQKDQGEEIRTSKKRKRDRSHAKVPVVTKENVADLWRKHIEGGISKDSNGGKLLHKNERRKKKRKNSKDEARSKTIGGVSHEESTSIRPRLEDDNDGKTKGLGGTSKEAEEHKPIPQSISQEGDPQRTLRIKHQTAESKAEGKARYEQRKLLASKKGDERAELLEASDITRLPSLPKEATSNTTKPFTKPVANPNTPDPAIYVDITPSRSPPPHPTKVPKLTPLQSQMQEKLISARFRHLNQTLYTTPSSQSLKIFSESPSSFISYHTGFRAQVAVWPQNPIDTFIADFQARATITPPPSQKQKWRYERKGKNKTSAPTIPPPSLDPLPRSGPSNICTIADLGCGDATLAGTLTPLTSKFSLRLLSFDLAIGDGPHTALISVADMCHLPLRANEVDIAVLCLALMGTNWVEAVDEVARVVRPGGEVWVAEVRSRFARVKTIRGVGKGDDEILAEQDESIAGSSSSAKQDTDVLPFVAVFQRRGLTLRGEPDLGNKMFVRMRFIREKDSGGSGIGGSNGGGGDGSGSGNGDGRNIVGQSNTEGLRGAGKKKRKFIDDREKARGGEEDESKVLKPCVYKIR